MSQNTGRRSSPSSETTSPTRSIEHDEDETFEHGIPIGLRWRSRTLFIITVVGIGIFTDIFTYAIIVPVLPFILRDRIGVPDAQLQMLTSMLLGVMAASSFVFSPVAGLIADKVGGRQKPFLAGLVALMLSTILLAYGETVAAIALARILQGMSSAVVFVVGLAICLETVGPSKLGMTIGTIFSFVGFGTQAAPVLGGVLYAKAGYGSVFGLSIALIGIDIILRLLMIEKKTAARYHKYLDSSFEEDNHQDSDEQEPLLGTGNTATNVKAYELQPPKTWLTSKMPILLTFRSSALLTAFYIGFVQAFLLGCYDSTIPLVAFEYYDFDSLGSGLLFLALGMPGLILGPIAGWVTDRYGARIVAVVGFLYLIPMHVLLRIPQPGGRDQVIAFGVILGFLSLGNAAIDSPSLVEAGLVVEKYHKANPDLFGDTGPYAQLYGINSMMFSLGVTVGPIVAGALKDTIGYGNMNLCVAALCASAAWTSWMFLGREPAMQ